MRREDFFYQYLRPLQCLKAVCETGNMSDAASILGISKSQLSKIIARLESDFREPLFVRTQTGSQPTDTAKRLSDFVLTCEERYSKEFPEHFHLNKSEFSLTIGTDSFSRSVLWPKIIAKFTTLAPYARFYVRDIATGSTDGCDIILAGLSMDAPFMPTLVYSDKLSVIKNSIHTSAHRAVLGPDESINALLLETTSTPAAHMQLPCFYSVVDTVAECAAWSIVPRQLANRVIGMNTYPIQQEDTRGKFNVYMNVRQSVATHPKITPFLHFVSRLKF
jgi:DNA-binding transcriptional LysR family regulator